MGTKVTSSSGSVLKEPEIQKLQMQAKIFKENSLNNLMHLNHTLKFSKDRFSLLSIVSTAFAQLFGIGIEAHYGCHGKESEFLPAEEQVLLNAIGNRWDSNWKATPTRVRLVGENEPHMVQRLDIPHIHACKQTLGDSYPQCSTRRLKSQQNSSSVILMTSDHNRSELGFTSYSNEQTSSKLVPKVVPLAVKTATSRQELELLFHHHIAMLRTTGK
ncbi:hypothetical protein Tco_1017433 [Tanacetum coccineum]|uniref:Uncharacterized protein n=1 Tax=Tanacetum coccineum TaxID=301880 RepID=A0ABQ5FRG1_9ASTR